MLCLKAKYRINRGGHPMELKKVRYFTCKGRTNLDEMIKK
jgi:hypothetical protein